MKIGEAEDWLTIVLRPIYDEREASNIADLVLEDLTHFSRMVRNGKKDEPLVVHQLHHLTEIHHRLLRHEPLQYVLGHAHFYGMKLFIDPAVLIPRPETEELVDWIIKDMKAIGKDVVFRQDKEADETTELKILDVGTGSGCIALALKKAMPRSEVWACDISDEALNVARRNGAELDIRVDFVTIDFLDEAQHRQLPGFDIIVSNPPYIPLQEKDTMHPNVVAHEPHKALFVTDEDPMVFYKALARFGKISLHAGGFIYAEIHEDRGSEIVTLFEQEGYKIELRKDMQGKYRMVRAWR